MWLNLPAIAISAMSAWAYALITAVWLATDRTRAGLLRGGQSAAVTIALGVVQLLTSFVLAVAMYAALYAALVPEAEAEHALHFGLCQRPASASRAIRGGTSDFGTSPLPARVARLTFFTAPTQSPHAGVAATSLATGSVIPPLARAYDYSVDVCLRVPESPPNVDAGTFLMSFRIRSASNYSLLAVDRPLVLRYRSDRVRALWSYFYALPLLLGWLDEAQSHCVQLTEAFANLRHQPAQRATLALVSPHACMLQVWAYPCAYPCACPWACPSREGGWVGADRRACPPGPLMPNPCGRQVYSAHVTFRTNMTGLT